MTQTNNFYKLIFSVFDMAENKLTIKEELALEGIDQTYFNILYDQLKKDNQLPPGNTIPWRQYKKVVDYLRYKKVLGNDNHLQMDQLALFNEKRNLEIMLEDADTEIDLGTVLDGIAYQGERPSGGIASCRVEMPDWDNHGGGIRPCRDYE